MGFIEESGDEYQNAMALRAQGAQVVIMLSHLGVLYDLTGPFQAPSPALLAAQRAFWAAANAEGGCAKSTAALIAKAKASGCERTAAVAAKAEAGDEDARVELIAMTKGPGDAAN